MEKWYKKIFSHPEKKSINKLKGRSRKRKPLYTEFGLSFEEVRPRRIDIKDAHSYKNYKSSEYANRKIRSHIIKTNAMEEIHVENYDLKLPRSVTNHYDFVYHITRINLFSKLICNLSNLPDKKTTSCLFFKDHYCWIDSDDRGIYRYFSKRRNNEGRSISLSIIDMIQILTGDFSYTHARNEIARLTNADYLDRRWELRQSEKVQKNLKVIEECHGMIKNDYPAIYRLCKNHFSVLIDFHNFSLTHIRAENSFEKSHIFYISLRFFEMITTKDHSELNKKLNLFATLGLINKVRPDLACFPRNLQKKALLIKGNLEHQHLITFYTIPPYTKKLLKRAESIAEQLLGGGVTNYKKVTEERLKSIFGDEYASTIFYLKNIDMDKLYRWTGVDPEDGRKIDTLRKYRKSAPVDSDYEEVDDEVPF